MIEWFQELLSGLTYSVSLANPGGLAALFALGILSDIGVPFFFALETFLFVASYYVGPLSTHVLLIILMLLAGRECGAAILYWLSAILGSPLIGWVGKRFPGLVKNLEEYRARLINRTLLGVVIVRLTPGLLQVPSLISGIMRLPYLRFSLGVAISSLIYDFVFVLFGFLSQIGLQNVGEKMKTYFVVAFIALIVIIVLFLSLRRRFRR